MKKIPLIVHNALPAAVADPGFLSQRADNSIAGNGERDGGGVWWWVADNLFFKNFYWKELKRFTLQINLFLRKIHFLNTLSYFNGSIPDYKNLKLVINAHKYTKSQKQYNIIMFPDIFVTLHLSKDFLWTKKNVLLPGIPFYLKAYMPHRGLYWANINTPSKLIFFILYKKSRLWIWKPRMKGELWSVQGLHVSLTVRRGL